MSRPAPAPRETIVSVSRVIPVARPVLAAYVADMGNAPDWYVNIRSVEWEGPASTRVGARAAFVAQFLGRRLAYTYEITDHEPGARMVLSTTEGPFPMETIYDWAEVGPEATRMTLTNRGYPTGFKAALMPVMHVAMRQAMAKDLAELSRIVPRLAPAS